MKTYAIIQARNGSSRLPGKVLLKILDKTILEYVVERVRRAATLDGVIVATTTQKEDDQIESLIKSAGIRCYRGSAEDVLDRYYQAAKLFNIGHIVRITADCPLIDPKIIDKVVNEYFKSNADYCSNVLNVSFPDGQDVEAFSFKALEDSWQNAKMLSERGHVVPYIKKHPQEFKLVNFSNEADLSDKRWTLDEKRDFEFIKVILEALYPVNPEFKMKDVLGFLKNHPEVERINQGINRNEGYQKSLREDKAVR